MRLQQLWIMPVDYRKKEVIILSQIFLDAADHHCAVHIANLFGDHSDRVGSPQAQGAGKKVGPVIQHLRRFDNAILCMLRDGARRRGIVESRRNRAGSQSQLFSDSLQGDSVLAASTRFLPRRWFHLQNPSSLFQNWNPGNGVPKLRDSLTSRTDTSETLAVYGITLF